MTSLLPPLEMLVVRLKGPNADRAIPARKKIRLSPFPVFARLVMEWRHGAFRGFGELRKIVLKPWSKPPTAWSACADPSAHLKWLSIPTHIGVLCDHIHKHILTLMRSSRDHGHIMCPMFPSLDIIPPLGPSPHLHYVSAHACHDVVL